jgi:hypothetical protein
VNLQAYANHRKSLGLRGTSHVAVINAINEGRIYPPAIWRSGRTGRFWNIDPDLADQQWADTTDPSEFGSMKGSSLPIGRADPPPAPAPAPPPAPDHPPPPSAPVPPPSPAPAPAKRKPTELPPADLPARTAKGAPAIGVSKQVKAAYEAKLSELDYKERIGELVPTKDVKAAASKVARQVRDLLLIIPSRNAARLVAMTDPEDARALLQAEIENAMKALADG